MNKYDHNEINADKMFTSATRYYRGAIDIIEIFEDFLETRDVRILSSDEAMKEEGAFEGNSARIYGMDFADLEADIGSHIVWREKRISECVYDLTLICADFIRETDLDSRMVFQEIYGWAVEFEGAYSEDDDYLTEIEIFGARKIAELKEVMR